jgi:hypothetical protein
MTALPNKAGPLVLSTLVTVLSGCATGHLYVSNPAPPRVSTPSRPIFEALSCMNRSGALSNTQIAVAVHSDGTGKTNYVSEGSTGSFLPQGTTASYVSETILLAGGKPQNYYELNTEMAMRKFGTNETSDQLAKMQAAKPPHYILSTAFTALDFLGGPTLDARYSGIGPQYAARGAALEVMAELYRPGDRAIIAMSGMNRDIIYQEAGVTISRFFSDFLFTGGITYQDQQKLQEATRDTVALAVADILARFDQVPMQCKRMVNDLKYQTETNQNAGKSSEELQQARQNEMLERRLAQLEANNNALIAAINNGQRNNRVNIGRQ